METTTAPATTGSITVADLLPRSVELFGDRVAQKHKMDGEWRDVTFAEMGEIVSEIGRGLIDIGVEPGERVSMLCTTRVEWAWCSFAVSAAGAVVVPIYPTNSPQECAWVAGNSESVAIVCEDASQVAKIAAIRDQLPSLRHVVVIEDADAGEDTVGLAIVAQADARCHCMSADLSTMRDGIGHMRDQRACLGAHFASLKTKTAVDAVWTIAMRRGKNGNRTTGDGANAEFCAAANKYIADTAERMRTVGMAVRISPGKICGSGHRNLAFEQLIIWFQVPIRDRPIRAHAIFGVDAKVRRMKARRKGSPVH